MSIAIKYDTRSLHETTKEINPRKTLSINQDQNDAESNLSSFSKQKVEFKYKNKEIFNNCEMMYYHWDNISAENDFDDRTISEHRYALDLKDRKTRKIKKTKSVNNRVKQLSRKILTKYSSTDYTQDPILEVRKNFNYGMLISMEEKKYLSKRQTANKKPRVNKKKEKKQLNENRMKLINHKIKQYNLVERGHFFQNLKPVEEHKKNFAKMIMDSNNISRKASNNKDNNKDHNVFVNIEEQQINKPFEKQRKLLIY